MFGSWGGGVGGELESHMLVSRNTSFRPPLKESILFNFVN